LAQSRVEKNRLSKRAEQAEQRADAAESKLGMAVAVVPKLARALGFSGTKVFARGGAPITEEEADTLVLTIFMTDPQPVLGINIDRILYFTARFLKKRTKQRLIQLLWCVADWRREHDDNLVAISTDHQFDGTFQSISGLMTKYCKLNIKTSIEVFIQSTRMVISILPAGKDEPTHVTDLRSSNIWKVNPAPTGPTNPGDP
jgi:hypothetical protein